MTENLAYQFRVCAENLAGFGKFSRPSEGAVCRDNIDRPGRPEVTGVGRNEVSIEWNKPGYDGGCKITGDLN